MPAQASSSNVIVDFIDQATGTYATSQQITDALTTGNYGGLTAIGADGQSLPIGTPLSPALQTGLPPRFASAGNAGTGAQPNYVLWGVGLFLVWYVFLRGK